MKKCTLFIVFICQLGFVNAQNTIEITYVANEGFMISDGKSKILIDGIFTEGWGNYHYPSAELQTKQREALYPFDSIDVLLVTHNHADHIHAAYTAEYISNNENAYLSGPPQVKQLLATTGPYSAISSRIISVDPSANSRVDTTINGIPFSAMPFAHPDDAGNTIQNLGFLLTINGFTIFHPGDADPASLSAFQNLNLAADSIDIAFIPHWFLDTEYGDMGAQILSYINPKVIIPMHVKTSMYSYYKEKADQLQGNPCIYFMETPMQELSLVKDSESVTRFIDSKYAYLGQTPPGDTAVMFAPGIVSNGNSHCRLTISPDGKEIFWNVVNLNNNWESKIYSATYANGKWSEPFTPSFAKEGVTTNVVFSPDSKKLFFEHRNDSISNWTIKYVEKADTGWSVPKNDGLLFSASSSFATNNKVYYSDTYSGTPWGGGIFSADYSAAGLSNISLLPESINITNIVNYTPFIAPDESYLLFSSNRPLTGGDVDNMHIHISFNNNGVWSTPQIINEAINFSGKATHPSISPDGKYLFFCGDDHNFYWVDIETLEQLRPTAINTIKKSSDISIYPNPGSGLINVSFGNTVQQATIEIYNLHGVEVFSKSFYSSTVETIDLTSLAKGLFLVKLTIDNGIFHKNICIE